MKSLCVLHYGHVYPPSAGSAIRTFNLAKMAARNFKTSIVACLSPKEFDFPSMSQEISTVRIVQYKLGSTKMSRPSQIFNRMNLSKIFNFYYTRYTQHMVNTIYENVADADLIQLEGVNLYALAAKLEKPIILDMHNVDYELIDYVEGWKKYVFGKYWSWKGKRYELSCLRRAKEIIVTSERDRNVYLASEKSLKEKMVVIPNCIDVEQYQDFTTNKPVVSTEKPVILFIGALNYPPNRIAVHDIMEMARGMQNYTFVVVGRYSGIMENHPENVVFTGFVEDVRPYITAADICIAPLRFGSGTRIKILEYLAMKKPVITTSKGAEGLEIDKECLIIEDDLGKYKEIIRDLILDEKKKRMFTEKAYVEVKTKYNWRIYVERLRSVYESALNY